MPRHEIARALRTLLFAFTWAGFPLLAAAQTGSITGTVRNAATSAPLLGVNVYVYDSSGGFAGIDTTDALGAYTVGGLGTGTFFALTNNALGYVNRVYDGIACIPWCVPQNGTPIAVVDGAASPGIDFALPPGGRISGTITDAATTLPLADVDVFVMDGSGQYLANARTNAAGTYLTEPGLPAGSYHVRTSNAAGYVNELFANVPCPEYCSLTTGTPVTVSAGSAAAGIDFALERGGRVSGIVVDAVTSAPVAGVWVEIDDAAGNGISFALTDAAGTYLSQGGIPTGTYFAKTSNDLGYMDQLYNGIPCLQSCAVSLGTPIHVTAGSTRPGINFGLERGGRVSGRVTDAATGSPLPAVSVWLTNASGFTLAYGYTDGTGAYTTDGVPAGAYFVRTSNDDGYVDELYADVPCIGACPTVSGTSVAVSAGAIRAGIDFALARGGRIAGTVRDAATSAPLTDVWIYIMNAAGQTVARGYADTAGRYVSDNGLPAGSYFAQTSNNLGYVNESFGGAPCVGFCSGSGTPISVAAAATTSGIDFELARGGRISGRLTDAGTGAGVPGTWVNVYSSSGGSVTSGYTDVNGHYVSQDGLPTGTYFARTSNQLGYLDKLYNGFLCVNCSPITGTPIGVTAGATTLGIDFTLGRGGRLSGTVTDVATGAPLAGASISVRNAAGTFVSSASTDGAGHYGTGAGLQAGSYYVRVSNELGYVNELYHDVSCVGDCPLTSGSAVSAVVGVTTPGIDFALTPGGRVEGTVTAVGTGAPLADVRVNVTDASGTFVASARTDALGRYRSGSGLTTGGYFVRTNNSLGYINELYDDVPCPGGCSVTSGVPVAVTLGGTTSGIHFGLGLGGSIRGIVRDALTGTPLAGVSVSASDGAGQSGFATTDSTGQYRMIGLAASTYYVRTSNSQGYLDELYNNIPCGSSCPLTTGAGIPVTAGGTATGIDFDLNRGGRVSGTITDAATGLPLAGVSVSILNAAGTSATWGTTDLAGHFLTESGVPSGNYFARTGNEIGFIDELYNDVACVGSCSLATGTTFAVIAGSTRSGVDFQLTRGGRISGTITDTATGAALGSVAVNVYDASGRFVTSGYADASGRYVTGGGLPPGTYYAQTNNWVGYVDELYDNKACAGSSCTVVSGTPIAVLGGATTNGVDFALSAGGRVAGRVIDIGTLRPIGGVSVLFYDASGRYVASGYTDAQGRYQSDTGLAAGTYFARTRNSSGYINRIYDALSCTGPCTVTLGTPIAVSVGSTASGINFALSAGGRIAGSVTDAASAAPLGGITVTVFDASGNFATSGSTSSLGQFVTRDGLTTGTYFARTNNALGYVNRLYNGLPCLGSCTVTAGTPISVVVGGTTSGIHFTLSPGARISGTVTRSAGGSPLPNASIALHDASGAAVAWASTDGLGNYLTSDGVPSGTYFAQTQNSQGYINEIYNDLHCTASCVVTSGAPLALVAGATTPGIHFALDVDPDVDADGIAGTIDKNQASGTDESAVASSDFNDVPIAGTTSGTIADRGGWSVRVKDVSPGGVEAALAGAGATPAALSACPTSGPEGLVLDTLGETATLVCGTSGSMTVRALVATPLVQMRKPVTGPATIVDLSTGQAATMGSPVVAAAENTQPIGVRFVDAAGATFGSLELDPGESIEANVIGAGAVEVNVEAGTVTVTVNGQSVTLREGESRTFGTPRQILDDLKRLVRQLHASRDIRSHVVAWYLEQALEDIARDIDRGRRTEARRDIRRLIQHLDLLTRVHLITGRVRDALLPPLQTVLASIS